MVHQIFRFLLTGGIATMLQYACLAIGADKFGLSPTVASGLGYLAGSIVSYLMNYFLTFNSKRPHFQAVSRFYLMVAAGLCINTLVMLLMSEIFMIDKWTSQLVATFITILWNFFASKRFVFNSR